jgi:hypothetical protein
MTKRVLFTIIFAAGLLFSCKAQTTQLALPPTLTPKAPQPLVTVTVDPLTISGEFVLNNTSTPGTDIGVETMNILLEYRPSMEDSWKKITVNCSFNPPAPTIFKDELRVQYLCKYQNKLPASAELRVTAEVKVFGSDEVFRLFVEPN